MPLVHGGPAGSCGEGSGCLGLVWDSELRNFLSEGSGNMDQGGKCPISRNCILGEKTATIQESFKETCSITESDFITERRWKEYW